MTIDNKTVGQFTRRGRYLLALAVVFAIIALAVDLFGHVYVGIVFAALTFACVVASESYTIRIRKRM